MKKNQNEKIEKLSHFTPPSEREGNKEDASNTKKSFKKNAYVGQKPVLYKLE